MLLTYLESNVVAEAYGRERHEAVVETVHVTPTLVFGEHRGAHRDNYTREQTGRQHEIHFRRLVVPKSEIGLRPFDHDGRELVQSLADTLEHHKPHGDADHRVYHTKRLSLHSHWSGVPVSLKKIHCVKDF